MRDQVARFFFPRRRRHTRSLCDWSSDVCSSDLGMVKMAPRNAPCTEPRPPTTTSSSRSIDWLMPNCSGETKRSLCAYSAPARPTMAADNEKDRKSVVEGKSGEHGRQRMMKKKKH